ncbi:MAG TPA: potassium-transporting ATPase subunit KdpC [Thermodesulfovibrionales bacterium]|jgi:K+-transporting ATPase ATPase C chain|nr:potassium-transporting ATPase subunit KdpC [Thermodesulfovibrionales bacterium]
MKEIKNGILLFVVLSLLTGVLYPAAVTALAQLLFPRQANGGVLIRSDGTPVGSSLIGQPFSDPKYFWPRPSATTDFPYNGLASGGSNLGPTNKDLINQIADRVKAYRESGIQEPLPADLVTASGSGLDPHISPAAAAYQVKRVAKAHGLDEAKVGALVSEHTEGRQFGILGDPRINVLELNLALDELSQR